ncbi:hypothetical protein L1887_15743 [Cichorium endivia]|nr:hypothetical protein L1887_15743 [Cichorium endivia]
MEATLTYPRKVRVILSDPDATDSSSEEGVDGERSSRHQIVREVVLGVKAGDNKDIREALERSGSVDQKQTETKKFRGVRMRKWGKWCSEIRDPFTKKRIWLGTYDTAEEALEVYNAKKEEFRGRQSAQSQPVSPASKEVNDEKKVVKLGDDPTRKLCKGVRRTESGRWSAKIRDPVKKSQVWLGTFDTEEDASKAFESKKVEFGSNRARSNSESGSSLKPLKTETLSLPSGDGGEIVVGN